MSIDDDGGVVDVAGVGFGPSNLALAIAIEEHNRTVASPDRVTATFLEKQDRFGWHRGMLIPGTTMQVSFLKDLVTQRDACSHYSFLNYLSERGRLTHFINMQSFFPTRLEFHDYLEWAATKVAASVHYGSEVSDVRWAGDHFEVAVPGADPVRARNIVLASGLRAKLPDGVVTGRRVFHNHGLLDHLRGLPPLRHQRFVVVGAGQSAAEVAAYLHENYTGAEVHAVFGKYGYTPADDSPYANRIFDPEAVSEFNRSPEELRQQLLDYHRGTNYSAVDPPLIDELYRREYSERVAGRRRLFVHGASEVLGVDASETGVSARVNHRPSQHVRVVECDAIVYATGFRSASVEDLVGSLARHCVADEKGRPVVARDYRVLTAPEVQGGVYLQGNTEHTHGLTSTLLSNIAIRSGELVASLAAEKVSAAHIDTTTTRREGNLVHQSL